MISRRGFLSLAPAPLLGADREGAAFDRYFLPILNGFLRNAARTSPSYAVCDFPDGTILPGAVGKSGKTYDSVTRMLPALAAWHAAGRTAPDLTRPLQLMFRNAFDPEHPDYWLPSPPDRDNQRQVESSIVAWSLWVLRDKLLPQLSSKDRANIQAWLASCTQVPVRRNNWAWFTAVNQAVRLDLAGRWKEFSGDSAWMLDDVKFLDSLATGDGWYTDSPNAPMYDYYNFWVFASHFLYWNRVIGRRYPEWSERFAKRLRLFLEKTPYFFGANGSHILFGRSLIYRWAVLTPLVLAYEQKLWPHSPGLLRRIVSRNLEYHWSIGSFDSARGKLRETYSIAGTHDICDSYVDNGHPYWGMQAFAFYLIPPSDPFWTAAEEPLPVERGDFRVRFEALKMLLAGDRRSGHVRWLQSRCFHPGADYRDKYTKFSYSSHFPFNIVKLRDRAVWDAALIFRDPKTGACASREGVKRGDLTADGLETEWWTTVGGKRIEVATRIELSGEFERRTHTITVPEGVEIEALEGSHALGLDFDEEPERSFDVAWQSLGSRRGGHRIVTWNAAGYGRIEVTVRDGINVISPRMAMITLRAALGPGRKVLASLHYSSPKPMDSKEVFRRAQELLARPAGGGLARGRPAGAAPAARPG